MTQEPKSITLTDILTPDQITLAAQLYKALGHWDSVTEIQAQLIEPNMAAINAKLGQENDPRYLAYAVVYVLSQAQES